MDEIILKPEIRELKTLDKKVTELLEPYDINKSTLMNLKLIIEEIFSNICNYAYPQKDKDDLIKIKMDFCENILKIRMNFIDTGIQFNPPEVKNPKSPNTIDDAQIGGLGISIMKEYADDIQYEYINNKNILTITKNLN